MAIANYNRLTGEAKKAADIEMGIAEPEPEPEETDKKRGRPKNG